MNGGRRRQICDADTWEQNGRVSHSPVSAKARTFSDEEKDIILFSEQRVKRHWLIWSAILLLGSLINVSCEYGPVFLQRSTESCVVYKNTPTLQCFPPHFKESCPTVSLIQRLSPPTLGNIVVMIGPTPLWLVICFALVSLNLKILGRLLLVTILVFIGLIDIFRYSGFIIGEWDISGHTFIFGLELLPWWFCGALISDLDDYHMKALKHAATLCEVTLLYFNFATAAFYHYPGEVFVPWLLVSALAYWYVKSMRNQQEASKDSATPAIDALHSVSSGPFYLLVACLFWSFWKIILLSSTKRLNYIDFWLAILYDIGVGGILLYFLYDHNKW